MQKLDITMASWVKAAVVVLAFAVLFLARDLLLVLLVSIVIASAIEPAALWAKRNGIPRLPAVIFMYIILAAGFAGLFYFLFLPLIDEVSSFVRTFTVYTNASLDGGALSDMFKEQRVFGGLQNSIISMDQLSNYLNSLVTFFSQGIFSSVSLIFGGLVSFVLIIVLSFYLAVQEDGIGKFLRLITPNKHEERVITLWRRSQKKIGLWFQGQLLASTLVALLSYVGLLIADVPHALLLAVIAGVFDLIPIIGPILASIPAIFTGFATGGLSLALIVAAIYLVIQQLESNVIFPIVHRRLVGIPPIITIISIAVWFQLAGFLGVLIAVPVAAILMELLSEYEVQKKVSTHA